MCSLSILAQYTNKYIAFICMPSELYIVHIVHERLFRFVVNFCCLYTVLQIRRGNRDSFGISHISEKKIVTHH